jgi:hypothetical protein
MNVAHVTGHVTTDTENLAANVSGMKTMIMTTTMTIVTKVNTRTTTVATHVTPSRPTRSIRPMEAAAGHVTADTESLVVHVSERRMTTVA